MAAKEFRRKLSAVFSADAVGYSRMMGEDEAATVEAITACRHIMYALITQHRGRVVDSPGDNLLAEFESVVDAVQCAVAVQKEFETRNAEVPENQRMRFRIGINIGDIIEEEGRIYGDGVNIAARLEALADPGGICVSRTAFDHIETKLPLGYEYLGDQKVKNISRPVGAYRVMMEPGDAADEKVKGRRHGSGPRLRSILTGAIVLALAVTAVLAWYFFRRPPWAGVGTVKKTVSTPSREPSAAGPSSILPGQDQGQALPKEGPGRQARDLTARGLKLLERPSGENRARAMALFERAVELDPGYVKAWVNLAWTHLMAARRGRDPSQSFKKAAEITRKALDLDDSDSDAHALLGNIYSRQARYGLALSEGRKAIDLDPRNPRAHFLLGTTMNRLGEFREAAGLMEKAMALNPGYPAYYLLWLGSARRMAGQYREALEAFTQLLHRPPRDGFPLFLPHLFLAETYAEMGREEEARTHAAEAERLNPRFSLGKLSRVATCAYKDPGLLAKRVEALRKAGLQ